MVNARNDIVKYIRAVEFWTRNREDVLHVRNKKVKNEEKFSLSLGMSCSYKLKKWTFFVHTVYMKS